MKQSVILRGKELFPEGNAIRKYSFKIFATRDSYGILAKLNRQLSDIFAVIWDKSALLTVVCPIQTAIFALSQAKCAHFKIRDCFGCLSPHNITA